MRIIEDEKKALSNVSRGNITSALPARVPRRDERNSARSLRERKRKEHESHPSSPELPCDAHYYEILQERYRATRPARHKKKQQWCIMREHSGPPWRNRECPPRPFDSPRPFTLSIIASLLFYWLRRGSCRQWIVTRVNLAGVKPSSRKQ